MINFTDSRINLPGADSLAFQNACRPINSLNSQVLEVMEVHCLPQLTLYVKNIATIDQPIMQGILLHKAKVLSDLHRNVLHIFYLYLFHFISSN